jgi:hypothetical protein
MFVTLATNKNSKQKDGMGLDATHTWENNVLKIQSSRCDG